VRIAAAVLGILIVVAVWVNVAVTLVIPRGRVGFIKVVDRLVDRVYTASGRLVRTWERRDALLASQPVVTLGLLLFIWLAGFVVGYGLLLWLPGGSFPDALREAGSSLFTLGFAARRSTEPSVVDFLAAASGTGHRRPSDRLPAHAVRGLQPPRNGGYAARPPGREPGHGGRSCWPGRR
jgi:hypothetical protein